MESRKKYLDIAKCLAILAIIDVHIQSGAVLSIGNTFHVATFLLLPGLLYQRTSKLAIPIATFVKKKAKSLLWPYLTLSIINVLFVLMLCLIRGGFEVFPKVLISSITLKGFGTLWFLPILFLGEIFTHIVFVQLQGKKSLLFGLLTTILILIGVSQHTFLDGDFLDISFATLNYSILRWPIVLIFLTLVTSSFLIIGYLLAPIVFRLEVTTKRNIAIVAILALVSIIIDLELHPFYTCDLHRMNITPLWIYYGCSLCGIMAVLSISLLLSFLPATLRFLEYIGKNSLIIMGTHKEFYICYAVYLCMSKVPYICLNDLYISILTLVGTLAIEIPIIMMANRSRLSYIFKYPFKK